MLPREFDPNVEQFKSDSNEVDLAAKRAKAIAADLSNAPGDLTIKKDDDCPSWTIWHTVQAVCLVAATAFVIWGFVR
ncbi:hypothetical protein CCB80_03125 [Armatimonadetes bacterium Uphvl-Ar1]|nr:hypothetical protein CCB80_03125 [Armatimonadetes bacterium Uphvl-Ar1]